MSREGRHQIVSKSVRGRDRPHGSTTFSTMGGADRVRAGGKNQVQESRERKKAVTFVAGGTGN